MREEQLYTLFWFFGYRLGAARTPLAGRFPGTVASCPRCEHTQIIPVEFTDVTLIGNGRNIVTNCPSCGHEWDITGGGDGTFSTGLDGRLVRRAVRRMVRQILRDAPVDDLRDALLWLRKKQAEQPSASAEDVSRWLDEEDVRWQWLKTLARLASTPAVALGLTVISMLVTLVGICVTVTAMRSSVEHDAQLDELNDQVRDLSEQNALLEERIMAEFARMSDVDLGADDDEDRQQPPET